MDVQEAYVVGFALDDYGRVALIEKKRPSWQAGRLNGIGGHVEYGETPAEAMRREFQEETGVEINTWELFVRMWFPGTVIHFYRARVTAKTMDQVGTTTDEIVRVVHLSAVLGGRRGSIIPNLSWLIPLAAHTADRYEVIEAHAQMSEAL